MKRLLGTIGITYLSVLAVAFYFGATITKIIAVISALALLLFLVVRRYRTTIVLPVVTAVVLVACLVNIVYTEFSYTRVVDKYNGYNGEVTAVLQDEPYRNYGLYYYEFETLSIGDEQEKVYFVLCDDEQFNFEPFDTVSINITLSDDASYKDLSKRCFLVGSFDYDEIPHFSVTSSVKKPLYYYAIKLRQAIRGGLESSLSEEAFSLCSALLIGDKYALSNSIRLDFNRSGVSHLIVVSGMHFSILVSFFLFCSRKLYKLRKLFVSLAFVFIFVYMAVTGFTPSVIRAGVMLLIYSTGFFVNRESYSFNSLGVAALFLTVPNPYIVADLGLIYSFATTASILVFAPKLRAKFHLRIKTEKKDSIVLVKIKRIFRKTCNGIIDVLCMNISAFVASFPISIAFFGAVSTMSVLSSFILFLPIQILLVLSLFVAVLSFIPILRVFMPLLSVAADFLTQFTFSVVTYISSFKFSYVYVIYDFIYLWLVLSIILAVIHMLSHNTIRLRVVSFLITILLLVGMVTATVMSESITTLDVYSVESGLAVMYRNNDTAAVLSLDCNTKNTAHTISKLERTVPRINFCSSVSNTTNSANSLNLLCESFAISDILLYDTKRDVSLPQTARNIVTPADVHTVHLSDSAVVTYYKINDVYITYLDSITGSVLILPSVIDASNIPDEFVVADTIIMRNCPKNLQCLKCDTLIISNDASVSHNIMQYAYSICDRVLLSADGDISLKMEV